MENWNKLKRAEKDTLAAKYAVTLVGEPPEPTTVVEVEKVPDFEWDKYLQKEAPSRKKGKTKVEAEEVEEEEVVEEPKKKKRKTRDIKDLLEKPKKKRKK